MDKGALRDLVANRKARLFAMQKSSDALTTALSDPANAHPSASAAAELRQLAEVLRAKQAPSDDPEAYEGIYLERVSAELGDAATLSAKQHQSEAEYLRSLVKVQQGRISAIQFHSKLTEAKQ
jgi:hypothetical protein